MKVKELIDLLQTFDPELLVAYGLYSEQCLMEKDDISVQLLGEPRNDGWVANPRPDKPSIPYVLFPGN